MEEIESKEFLKTYSLVRHIHEPYVGGWDLYKNKQTNEKYLIKEIRFYSESDRDEYLPRLTHCQLYLSKKDNGFVKCLKYCRRNLSLDEGVCFVLYALFEYFEATLDKVISRKIKDSETFSMKEIFKVLLKAVSSLEILERLNYTHGDLRAGNFAVMGNGSLKILWVPFAKPPVELMQDKGSAGVLKAMNPSPELIDLFTDASLAANAPSMYNDMAGSLRPNKNDVYSLAIVVLKLCNLYATEGLYVYHPLLKVHTKRVEQAVVRVHSTNPRIGFVLNKMLAFDPSERWSFSKVRAALDEKGEQIDFEIGDLLKSIGTIDGERRPYNEDPEKQFLEMSSKNFDLLDERPADIELVKQSPRGRGNPSPVRSSAKLQATRDRLRGHSPPQSQKCRATADPNSNLFMSRGLAALKAEFIGQLEATVFFDSQGKLRSGIKIKETAGDKYVGELFCGSRSGFGIYYHKNGDVAVGAWANNRLHGEGVYLYGDGGVYLGALQAGRKEGFGRYLHANGDVYEGEWTHDKKNGAGLYSYYCADQLYEGAWLLNYKEGWGTLYGRSGEWVDGEFKANKLVFKSATGVDDHFDRPNNVVDFFSNKGEWRDIINKLQGYLNRRCDNNYNFVGERDYENLEQLIENEKADLSRAAGADVYPINLNSNEGSKRSLAGQGASRDDRHRLSAAVDELKPSDSRPKSRWNESNDRYSVGLKERSPSQGEDRKEEMGLSSRVSRGGEKRFDTFKERR